MIDDEDDDVDLTPRPWSWWYFGSTFCNWLSQLFMQTGNAFKELDEHMTAHAIWQTRQREFEEAVVKAIESIPVIGDNEKGTAPF